MKSRLAALAIKDIDGILGSLARESPTAANGFRVKIAEVRVLIEQFPESGRKTRRAGIRVVNSGRLSIPLVLSYFSDRDRDPPSHSRRPKSPQHASKATLASQRRR